MSYTFFFRGPDVEIGYLLKHVYRSIDEGEIGVL